MVDNGNGTERRALEQAPSHAHRHPRRTNPEVDEVDDFIDAVILHIPISTLNTGCNGIFGPNIRPYLQSFAIYEKL
jgi:hypothetical protein